MRYIFYSLFLCLLAFSAAWAYRVNYETRDVIRNLKLLQNEIARQEEKLIMLEGEWSYLNRPERLSRLTEHFFSHLGLMPVSAENFAHVGLIKIKDPFELDKTGEKNILDGANILFEDSQ